MIREQYSRVGQRAGLAGPSSNWTCRFPASSSHVNKSPERRIRDKDRKPSCRSDSASVSVERVSPTSLLRARSPAPPAAMPFLPSWDCHPIGTLLLLQLHVHVQPLRSTVATRFPATMGCPTPVFFLKKTTGLPGSSAD